MDEEALNLSIRKFLKKVGVNSQLAIEKAVREAIDAGTFDGRSIPVTMRLSVDRFNIDITFDDELKPD